MSDIDVTNIDTENLTKLLAVFEGMDDELKIIEKEVLEDGKN